MIEIISHSVQETQKIAEKLARECYAGAKIFLFGNVGAGKTHFVQSFLQTKQVKEEITSPTYAFYQRYETAEESFLHIDAYRIEQDDIGLDEIFLDSELTVLTEWSENLEHLPSPRIEVRFEVISKTSRKITIEFIGFSMPQKEIQELVDYYKIPPHVYAHIQAVVHVSEKVTEKLLKKGEIIDTELIKQAAILHDLVRYVDFKGGLIKEYFPYPVDEETWKFWEETREKFQNRHHADVARMILEERGYDWLGKIIMAHKSSSILHGLKTLAEKIVHYADKRAKHNVIVPLEERLKDLHDRYAREDKSNRYWDELNQKCLELEEELDAKNLVFDTTVFNFEA